MASNDEASRGKHKRSPDERSKEGLKLRKHHDNHHLHQHSYHHHHLNCSKHECDDLPLPITTTSSFRLDDHEKEEGEILEEEEEYYDVCEEDRLKKADSDIESSAIKSDESFAKISPPTSNQGFVIWLVVRLF